jgi:importin-4
MQSKGNGRLYTAEELCAVIGNILHVVDNNERRNSEVELTQALQQHENAGQLVTILCGSLPAASAGVRQVAAVLLRKRIFSLWRFLSPEQQQELRQLLLRQLGSETVRPVRFAIAHVVTRLAKADANRDGGGWPELQRAVRVAAEDSRVEMRELAMVLLYSIGEVFAEENALSGLAAESVVRGLRDSEVVVQTAAVKAAMVLLPALHEHPSVRSAFLAHAVPVCISVLQQGGSVEAKVPLCVSVIELLEQLFSDLTVKKHGALLQDLAQALVQMLANKHNHPRVRENCGTALGQLATLKPKFVASPQLLDPLVQVCLALMSEDNTISISEDGTGNIDGEDFDDSDDDDADMLHVISACMVGGRLLSALATTVASKAFTAVLLPYVSKVIDAPASADARTRKATMIALACLAEGHSSYLRRRVGYMLGITQTLLRDADPVPREAAAFALSYFCSRLQPEILLHRDELLPMLTPLLQDSNDLVRRRVAQALDTLCENLEENLDPFVPTLLPAVMAAIPISSLETQCRLCGVLSSMGMTHSTAFASHGPALLEVLRQPFTLNSPETMALRAQVTETVGVVGAAMGREAFAPYFPFFMQEVVASLQTRSAAVREQSFGFLANMCELFQEDFVGYLDDSLRCALDTIEEDRAIYKNKHLLAKENGGGSGGVEGLAALAAWKDDDGWSDEEAEEEEDGGDDAEEIHLRVRTADVEEKSSAVYSVGVFADVLLSRFGEAQIAACWEALTGLDAHYYPKIRSNALIALAKLAKASAGISAEEMQARSRAASPGQDVLPLPVRDRIDELLNMLLRTIEEEDVEKEVVSAACEAVSILLSYFGTQCCIDGPDAVLRDVVQVLRGTMPCQRADDDELGDSDDAEDDAAARNVSYEDYQQRLQGDPAAADKAYYAQGKDPLFRRADEAIEAHTSAIMSAMMQHQQSGVSTAPPQLPSPGELPPWYTVVQPEMVVQGVHLGDEHDEVVVDAAVDMLESVAKAYGPLLQPYMPFLVPLLALHADVETRPAEGLATGVGTLAAVLQAYATVHPGQPNMGSSGNASPEQLLAPFMDTAVQLSFAVMAGSDESAAKANSAYLLRILVEGCPAYFVQHASLVPHCLQGLWSIVGNEEEIPEAVDNAVSATCSFVRCLPLQNLPLEQVIPSLMAHLPMKIDKGENASAVATLCYLLNTQHATTAVAVKTWLPAVVQAVANMLASRTVEDAEKQQLVQQGVAVFAQAHCDEWRQARQQTLSSEQLAALSNFNV